MGLVNAVGNLGGFRRALFHRMDGQEYHSTAVAFSALRVGMLVCVGWLLLAQARFGERTPPATT